jgi:hypothetical protein
VIDQDPRFESGVAGPFHFDEQRLARRYENLYRRRYSSDEFKAAITWLERSYLIMAIGPHEFKLSPDGIAYFKDPKTRDPRLPKIPPEFGDRFLTCVEEQRAFSKQLADECAAEDAASGHAVDLPEQNRLESD